MRIIEANPLEDFQLFLRFDDGSSGIVDLSSYAGRGVFSAWLKPGVFHQIHLTESGTLEWPDSIDLCPDALYLRMTGKSPEDLFPSLQSHLIHA